MMRRFGYLTFLHLLPLPALAEAPARPGVFTIMDEDPEGLLKILNNPWGDPGTGQVEEKDVFAGSKCIRITPLQRYTNLAGWTFKVREKPKDGEYRYLRFAWKSAGGSGIMLQMHDLDWTMRYFAGNNVQGWLPAKKVADRTPREWTVVTMDLYGDFGDRDVKGIALTVFDGEYGLFDHIHVARTIAELDRIPVQAPRALSANELADCWKLMGSSDDREGYRAKWGMIGDGKKAVPFLRERLLVVKPKVEPEKVAKWIQELDHEKFTVREQARRNLETHLDDAAGALRRELGQPISAEARRVIDRLVERAHGGTAGRLRMERSIQALELIDTPESRALLTELTKGARLTHP